MGFHYTLAYVFESPLVQPEWHGGWHQLQYAQQADRGVSLGVPACVAQMAELCIECPVDRCSPSMFPVPVQNDHISFSGVVPFLYFYFSLPYFAPSSFK